MIEVRKTEIFAKWLDGLHDIRARARILVRIQRFAAGNPGDVKPVGGGISELRIDLSGVLQKARAEGGNFIGWWRQKHSGQGYQNRFESGTEFIGVYHGQNRNYPIRCR